MAAKWQVWLLSYLDTVLLGLWVEKQYDNRQPAKVIISPELSPLKYFWPGLSSIMDILRSYTATV